MTRRVFDLRALTELRRWTHALVVRNWGLKLLALIITLVLWYTITGQRVTAAIRLQGIQLVFLHPDSMDISNNPPVQVDAIVRGNKKSLDTLNARDLVASVDVRSIETGEHLIRLTPATVTLQLPDDVYAERFDPAGVSLVLENDVERDIKVEAQLEGQLPAGYELVGVRLIPEAVRIRGPQSIVNSMERVVTQPVSVQDRTTSFTIPQVALNIGNSSVVALDRAVEVSIQINEDRVERTFHNIPVEPAPGLNGFPRPATANAVVRGPRPLLDSLHASDLAIILRRSNNGAVITPELSAPAAVAGQVELISTEPSRFTITE